MNEELLKEIGQIEVPSDISNIFNMKDYVSVVTGGASGLGEAIALGLASFGSNVALCDMNPEGLKRVKSRIEALGVQCDTCIVDVTDWDNVLAARDQIMNRFGKVDVLVNSAGMNIRKPALELKPEEFRKILNVDLTGTFLCCRAFGEVMAMQKKGSIINLASTNGHVALEKNVAYAASKGGVVQLTKVLALEWAEYNIRVNALSPGHHKTPLVAELVKDNAWYQDLVSRFPMGRFGEAYEIIGPAVFLASRASSFMTGHSLLSDGGYTAK